MFNLFIISASVWDEAYRGWDSALLSLLGAAGVESEVGGVSAPYAPPPGVATWDWQEQVNNFQMFSKNNFTAVYTSKLLLINEMYANFIQKKI